MTMTWSLLSLAAACWIYGAHPAGRIAPNDTDDADMHAEKSVHITRLLPVIGVASLIGFLLLGEISTIISVVIATATAGYLLDNLRRSRRDKEIDNATQTVLGHVVADIRAGALIGPAFARAAGELPASAPAEVTDALAAVATHTRRGGTGYDVLDRQAALRPLARLWKLSDTHGIPVATLLEQAKDRLQRRQAHRSSTAASLQGPQATAGILACLPVVGILMGMSMGADPLGLLLGGGLGGILLVSGTTLIAGGVLISRWIIERASA